MQAALYDPVHGYYCTTGLTKWGREGDYRTSPERSHLFAATLARYCATLYDELGRPPHWTILEVGGGDGTFAGGVLQTLQRYFPAIFAATSYVIDELSSHSAATAAERLQEFGDRLRFERLEDTEIDPGIVFSNELLDAFPVHRVMMQGDQLQEFYVGVARSGEFEWLLAEPSTPLLAEYFLSGGVPLGDRQIAEVNLEAECWLQRVATKMRTGYLVTVDYGAEAAELYSGADRQQGTLRGFSRHEFVENLLARPGEHDITGTVNWNSVISTGMRLGLKVVRFERQDKFLLAAGLLEQLEIETTHCEGEAERLRLSTAAREMILPAGMAAHFQVLVQAKYGRSEI